MNFDYDSGLVWFCTCYNGAVFDTMLLFIAMLLTSSSTDSGSWICMNYFFIKFRRVLYKFNSYFFLWPIYFSNTEMAWLMDARQKLKKFLSLISSNAYNRRFPNQYSANFIISFLFMPIELTLFLTGGRGFRMFIQPSLNMGIFIQFILFI